MGGMFYSLQEVIEKLNRTEQEIKELVRIGKLREFRDGQSLLFKIDEVETLLLDTTVMNALGVKKDDSKGGEDAAEILLVPDNEEEEEKTEKGAGETDADTVVAGEGINVLEETSGEYTFSEDTKTETRALSEEASLDEIEKDVSLDSFGSGSGLLDLSLQADDTSLGGILDEIYTPEGAGEKKTGGEDMIGVEEKAGAGGSGSAAAEEAEQIFPEEQITPIQPQMMVPGAVAIMPEYVEPQPDAASNLYGVMLLLVLLAVVYAIIVVMTGAKGAVPAILGQLQGMVWYIMGGAAGAVALIFGMSFMVGGSKTKVEKKPKEVKEEEKKEKKAKKEKKSKKGKEEKKEDELPPAPEAEGQA
jgi:hypothetical protein